MADPYSMNRRGRYDGPLLSNKPSAGVRPMSEAAPAAPSPFLSAVAKRRQQEAGGGSGGAGSTGAPMPATDWSDVKTGSDTSTLRNGGTFNGKTIYVDDAAEKAKLTAQAAPPVVARRSAAQDYDSTPVSSAIENPGGAKGGVYGDEDQRRLENALLTIGRGSPSTRRALIENFGAQQSDERAAELAGANFQREAQLNGMRDRNVAENDFRERQLKADLGNEELGMARREDATKRMELQQKGMMTPAEVQAMKIADAKAEREFAVDDAKYQGELDATDEARVQTMMKENGIAREAALEQLALENATTGTGTGSRPEALGRRGIIDGVADKIDQGAGALDGLMSGDGFRPLQDKPMTPAQRMRLDEGQVEVSERGGPAGWLNRVGSEVLGNDTPRFKVGVGEDSYNYLTKAQLDKFQTLKAAQANERQIREAAKRRTP